MPIRRMHDNGRNPQLRVTIDANRLQAVYWNPLMSGVSAEAAEDLKRSGLAMAHLWCDGPEEGRELTVRWLVPPDDPARCPVPLRDWARCIGYVRLWLPGAPPLELDRVEAPLAPQTSCDWCAWEPGPPEMEFWQHARAMGTLPPQCPRCGTQLPQWVSEPVEVDADADPLRQTPDSGDDSVPSAEPTPDPEEVR